MSAVGLLSGISGLSLDSPFLSLLSSFCLVLLVFLSFFFPANCQFSCLFLFLFFCFLFVFSLQTILHVLLSDKLFCVALVKQVQVQIDGWWYVCAVCCHMALIFVIIHYVVFCVCIVRIYSLFILSLICIVSDIRVVFDTSLSWLYLLIF